MGEFTWYKFFLVLIAMVLLIIAGKACGNALAHETDEFKHNSVGPCYGWAMTDVRTRICFLDEERTMCQTLIHVHDMWHVSKPYKCDEED